MSKAEFHKTFLSYRTAQAVIPGLTLKEGDGSPMYRLPEQETPLFIVINFVYCITSDYSLKYRQPRLPGSGCWGEPRSEVPADLMFGRLFIRELDWEHELATITISCFKLGETTRLPRLRAPYRTFFSLAREFHPTALAAFVLRNPVH